MSSKKRIAAYIRVSTDEQAKEGFSIEAQVDACESYCKCHDLGELYCYIDEGYSGGNPDRPEYQHLIADIKADVVGAVIVWRQDRLSRNIRDLLDWMDTVADKGVLFITVTESFDVTTSSGRLTSSMMGAFGQYFLESLKENINSGLDKRAEKGYWNTTAPTGGRMVDGMLEWTNESWRVQRAFVLACGDDTLNSIAKQVGINASTLRGVLRSRVYLGEVVRSGVWHKGLHEPLISEEVFDQVQKKRPARKRDKSNNSATHVFSGTLRCGLCERLMTSKHSGKGILQFACWHRGGAECEGVGSKASSKVERAFLAALELLKEDKTLKRDLREAWERKQEHDYTPLMVKAAKEVEALTREINNVVSIIGRKPAIDDILIERVNELKEKREVARDNMLMWERWTHEKENRVGELEKMLAVFESASVREIWDEATNEEKRALLNEYVYSIYIFRDHAQIRFFNVPEFKVWWSEVDRGEVRPLMEREMRVA